ncbi:MAG: hypothetical protein K0S93_1825 [Nitrososphaeraceae archaeon]|nr:hypothetical protein [Nitrososphaeraceae archaeon]
MFDYCNIENNVKFYYIINKFRIINNCIYKFVFSLIIKLKPNLGSKDYIIEIRSERLT